MSSILICASKWEKKNKMLIKLSNKIKVTNQKVSIKSNEMFRILSFSLDNSADSNVKSLIYNPKDTFLDCIVNPLKNTQSIYLHVKETQDYKPKKELIGLLVSKINIIQKSLTEGFTRSLILEGVGYKVNKVDNQLIMDLGYACSHRLAIPAEIKDLEIKNVGDNLKITGSSDSFEGLNLFMSKIKEIKPIKKQPKVKSKGFRWDN